MWFEVACIGKRPNWLQLLTAKLFSFFFFSSFLWHRIALTISLSLTYSLKHTRRGKIQLKSSSTLLVCVCVDHCGREESCCSHAPRTGAPNNCWLGGLLIFFFLLYMYYLLCMYECINKYTYMLVVYRKIRRINTSSCFLSFWPSWSCGPLLVCI
jgi:hypothetical protein